MLKLPVSVTSVGSLQQSVKVSCFSKTTAEECQSFLSRLGHYRSVLKLPVSVRPLQKNVIASSLSQATAEECKSFLSQATAEEC